MKGLGPIGPASFGREAFFASQYRGSSWFLCAFCGFWPAKKVLDYRTTRLCRPLQARSSAAPSAVHRIPLHVRDDRETPLEERDAGSPKSDLGCSRSEIFLQLGLDRFSRARTDLPVGQSHCGQAVHGLATSSLPWSNATKQSTLSSFLGKDGLLRRACHRTALLRRPGGSQ